MATRPPPKRRVPHRTWHGDLLVRSVGRVPLHATRRALGYMLAGYVVALEADPETAEVYRRNVANLSGIQFHALAAVRPGVEQLRFCQMGRGDGNGHTGASFATEVVRRLDPSFSAGAPICVVPAAPLSRILEAAGIPQIDILKLDCEGAEPEILHDLKNAGWLRKTRWIRGEWHHVASISLIQEALQETHTYHIGVNPHPWGAFIAHRSE